MLLLHNIGHSRAEHFSEITSFQNEFVFFSLYFKWLVLCRPGFQYPMSEEIYITVVVGDVSADALGAMCWTNEDLYQWQWSIYIYTYLLNSELLILKKIRKLSQYCFWSSYIPCATLIISALCSVMTSFALWLIF